MTKEGSGCATFDLFVHRSTISFVFLIENKNVSEVSKFRVNSLYIVYYCAIHNLPTFSIY